MSFWKEKKMIYALRISASFRLYEDLLRVFVDTFMNEQSHLPFLFFDNNNL